jgi:hypothetical protein
MDAVFKPWTGSGSKGHPQIELGALRRERRREEKENLDDGER